MKPRIPLLETVPLVDPELAQLIKESYLEKSARIAAEQAAQDREMEHDDAS